MLSTSRHGHPGLAVLACRLRVGRLLPVLALIFSWSPVEASDQGAPCRDDAQRYWSTFRAAALKSAVDKVATFAKFPFEIRGTLDDGATRKLARADFVKAWPRLLRSDPGLSAKPTTMKAFIKANVLLTPGFCSGEPEQFRVGNWVFQLTSNEWRFVKAFVEE
jgi:hypothetical protein